MAETTKRPLHRWHVYCRLNYSQRADSPVAYEGKRFVVYGPNNRPASLTADQIGSAIKAAERQCGKQLVSFEVLQDGEYNAGLEEDTGEALSACPGDVAARDSF